ncbi:MAG: penicillin-binding protein 1C [Proteobacteria bacterium]|nr:penicillin-binding protein 1C [Pseudomonadota bacterium]MBU1737923.1 penicillin-binding protein 1C [Pseudomonadota bacterium]
MKQALWISSALLFALMGLYIFCPEPELKEFQNYSRAYFDRNSTLLRITLARDQRYRLHIPLEEISPLLREATVLYEDQRFFQHHGVDLPALFRAGWQTYISGQQRIGASTITMQVARLRWGLNSRTIPGKLRQILRALQLTRHYSKSEILEAYLNLASYGRNIEGVEAASLIYFNKQARDLSLPEALTLSVIPQNPNRRNPTADTGISELLVARNNLFTRWLEKHPEDEEKRVFLEIPLVVRPPEKLPFFAPHFVNDLESQLPLLRHGTITTTIDLTKQLAMEKIVASYVDRRKTEGIRNGVALLLNYRTMEIEAAVGSADFYDPEINGQVIGTRARRSPGSALKPFVYALALNQGLIHPLTMLKDAPKRFGGFTPENFDQRFMGPVFARDALISSRNVPAVHLQAQLENPGFYDFLAQAEITLPEDENYYGLALSLGGAEVSMEEMARLYAILPNGGELRQIKKIRTDALPETGRRMLSPEACFLILDILKDNPPPEAAGNENLVGQVERRNEVAWKTGTSFAFRDAWAVGVSGSYVLAVWVGDFAGQGNASFVGRRGAGPLLFELFTALIENSGWRITEAVNPDFLNLTRISVCASTGDLPGRYCPGTRESWFIPGISPIKLSNIHRAVPIDKKSGLRACLADPETTEMKSFEFWPSDLQHIFNMAGISIKTPPPYEEECSLNEKSSSGRTPVIISPQSSLIYALQSDRLKEQTIPFSAVVDGDVNTVYWFVNDGFVGKAERGEPLLWQGVSGAFAVRVVDDHGRAAERKMTVEMVR